MPKKVKELWEICVHPDTSTGSVKAVNGDSLEYVVCEECGTILTWKRAKKEAQVENPQQAVEEPQQAVEAIKQPPAKSSGRPTSARPKPKAKKPVVEDAPIVHSDKFPIKDITSKDNVIGFKLDNNKGGEFIVSKNSEPEKIKAVLATKKTMIGVKALVIEYTTVDENGIPSDGTMKGIANA